MEKVLPTAPISEIKKDQNRVLTMLDDGPVVMMQRSTPAAVMVAPDEWNATAQLIADLREQLGRERRMRIASDWYAQMLEDPSAAVTQEEFDKMLAEMGLEE